MNRRGRTGTGRRPCPQIRDVISRSVSRLAASVGIVTESPTEDDHEDSGFGFELSEEDRQRLAEALAPMTKELSEALGAAVAPFAARIREQWAETFSGLDLRPLLPAFEFPPELVERLRRWAGYRPSNWPPGVDVDRMTTAITVDGIPLVWAPREDVVADVLNATDWTARVAVLVEHQDAVIEDCQAVLDEVTSPTYEGKVLLARQALNALKAGHPQPAQALAVVVTESAVARAIHPTYDRVKNKVRLADLEDVHIYELRLRAALAPLHRFYTEWTEGKTPGDMPKALSRHVTVHSAAPEHFTEANAVLAVLTASTVLRALQELEEVRIAWKDPTWLPK
ncbi:hypothetical protein SAMN05444351_3668 [Geodermatophilus nigrescens]|uniref:Uncharacterized protein n=1 Tax=Geodermatophilus nigrescens TaxID=1070870 RepID=A0A1M5NS70_9ACTN|nr:hypothetical protein SAMN05444351_3668 [Geodermatophilus nigrescens]